MGEPNLDIKRKMVHEIIVDSYNVSKKYISVHMNDEDWDEFIKDTDNLSDKWKCQGIVYWMLYRKIIGALRDTLIAFQKGATDGTN
jgi:hypothetical protein